MSKLIIIQTAIPDYRKEFFKRLKQTLGERFELYGGGRYFEKTVITDQTIEHKAIPNHYFFYRKALFQEGVLKLVTSSAVLVLEMNPRIVSNWLLLLVRKILGRKTVLWGHAWPRAGKESKSDLLRHMMRQLSSSIIVYTKTQQRELKLKMPNKKIYAAPNALIIADKMQSVTDHPRHFIYVGRLTEPKKVLFLVKAFSKALEYLPNDVELRLIGDGDQRLKIEEFIRVHSLGKRVKLYGHISDYEILKKLYAQSLFSVSPGYAGLSITQSFGFGVPMLISRDEPHSPEIEAVTEGENALFYETDDVIRFRESVEAIYTNTSEWIEKRDEIAAYCRSNYSVEAMAQVFSNLVGTNGT